MKKWIFLSVLCLWNAILYADGIPAVLEPLEGQNLTGTLTGFENEKCTFHIKDSDDAAVSAFSTRTLRAIQFQTESESEAEAVKKTEISAKNGVEIRLGDSVLCAEQFFLQERKARILLSSPERGISRNAAETASENTSEITEDEDSDKNVPENEILIPSEKLYILHEILFQKSELGKNKDLDADWAEIRSMDAEQDILVVLRNEKLSFYYGTVLEVGEKSVRFEHEGETLDVKRKHIFAVRFAVSSALETPSAVSSKTSSGTSGVSSSVSSAASSPASGALLGILTDSAGSRYAVSTFKVSPDGANIKIRTVSGFEAQLSSASLRTLDFTEGRAVFLSELTPESVTWTPYFSVLSASSGGTVPSAASASSADSASSEKSEISDTKNAGTVTARELFYAPKMNRAFTSEKIRLGGVEYTHGVEISSRTRVVFRLPGEFRTFKALLGIDDSVRPAGNVDVTVSADDRVLFQGTVSGKDVPQKLELDVTGTRRLTIYVDYGKNLDVSDYTAFADAQLLK